ncbi:MAG: flagellar biosynthesis protein FlhF [Desulfovibrionales bacterium]|nr:flagellar biosynthesis protein FlhF [Desulfovibrionales bacterium]
MRVKTFTGPSTKEIMARIKAELGPDAIILSTQTLAHENGPHYEIMAALDDPGPAMPEIPVAEPPTSGEWNQLREEWTQLRKQLLAVLKPQMDLGLLTPRQQVVLDYLEREGVRQDVLISLWEKFRRRPDEPTLTVMDDMLSVRPWLHTCWEHKFHILSGPHGCGKTSTLLRLALAMQKKQPQQRIMVVNADHSQGKGRLYLRHYAELSGLSYREVSTPEHWAALPQDAQAHDIVFIDVPGVPGRQNIDTWLHEISGGALPALHVHLVLSPLFSSAQMEMFSSRLRGAAASSVIWTKLDEACSYGEILNQTTLSGLPISLLSVGPELKNSLVQPKNQDIWKLLLRHELPQPTN